MKRPASRPGAYRSKKSGNTRRGRGEFLLSGARNTNDLQDNTHFMRRRSSSRAYAGLRQPEVSKPILSVLFYVYEQRRTCAPPRRLPRAPAGQLAFAVSLVESRMYGAVVRAAARQKPTQSSNPHTPSLPPQPRAAKRRVFL